MEITDAYGHCGIRKYKPYEDVDRITRRHGVKRAVLVQHMGEFDNSYIEGIVAKEPGRFAGVFLVDLNGAAPVDEARRWTERGRFRGIRLPVESLATHGELWRWCAQLGLNFVLYGGFNDQNVRILAQFAAQNRHNTIQVAHLAFPSWRPALKLGDQPNVVVQVSGMHQLGKAPYEELVPVVKEFYGAFGRERLVYGSNFPVMAEDAVYALEIELLSKGRLGVPEDAAPAVMNGNARRVWFDRSRIRAGSLLWSAMCG